MAKVYMILVLAVLLVSSSACTTVQGVAGGYSRAEKEKSVATDEAAYLIQPGDQLEIKFYYDKELNEQVVVRPDGMISLQLVDEVKAAGHAPAELDKVLTEKYAGFIKEPELTVIVRQFAEQKIYVGGEVNNPGVLPFAPDLTAFRALVLAGNYKTSAALDSVIVLRNRPGSKVKEFYTVNLLSREPVAGQVGDLTLQPYDVVFVPKSRVARVGQFVKQYITDIIPISYNVGFSWVYDLNNEVQVR